MSLLQAYTHGSWCLNHYVNSLKTCPSLQLGTAIISLDILSVHVQLSESPLRVYIIIMLIQYTY